MHAVRHQLSRWRRRKRSQRNFGIFAIACLLAGLLGATLWKLLVNLVEYSTADDNSLVISERSAVQFFQADAYFVVIGLLLGVTIGIIAWSLFKKLGWPVVLIALVGALVAALLSWGLGYLFGPNEFEMRAAAANPGERVPIDLTLRSWTAVLVWPFSALMPILLYSTLGKDQEDHYG